MEDIIDVHRVVRIPIWWLLFSSCRPTRRLRGFPVGALHSSIVEYCQPRVTVLSDDAAEFCHDIGRKAPTFVECTGSDKCRGFHGSSAAEPRFQSQLPHNRVKGLVVVLCEGSHVSSRQRIVRELRENRFDGRLHVLRPTERVPEGVLLIPRFRSLPSTAADWARRAHVMLWTVICGASVLECSPDRCLHSSHAVKIIADGIPIIDGELLHLFQDEWEVGL